MKALKGFWLKPGAIFLKLYYPLPEGSGNKRSGNKGNGNKGNGNG